MMISTSRLSARIALTNKVKITVTALVALNAGEETCVFIELSDGIHSDTQKHTVLTNQYAELRIKKGEIDREKYEEIVGAASIAAAYKKGLAFLGYGSYSKKTLYYKLKSRGFDDETANEAIQMLCQNGYVNEDGSCTREAERCIAKLWGKKRIVSHLYSKGFSETSVREALLELDETDYIENCKKLILRDHKHALAATRTDKAAASKLIASLTRMGYSFSEIKSALADILK